METQFSKGLEKLDTFNNNNKVNITREHYLDIVERMGEEVDPEKLPPVFSDLHPSIQTALLIYDKLSDTYTGGQISTYAGKDLSALELLLDVHYVDTLTERKQVIETISYLDKQNIESSRKQAKAELDKARAK